MDCRQKGVTGFKKFNRYDNSNVTFDERQVSENLFFHIDTVIQEESNFRNSYQVTCLC